MTKYQRCNFIIQIHQFTIKIDKINISLLFECVKIVEFNFNSHVFHVMYQETRFLNQDACFLNQEGRRQFLISFVSERDWNRTMCQSTSQISRNAGRNRRTCQKNHSISTRSWANVASNVSTSDEELRRRFKNEIGPIKKKAEQDLVGALVKYHHRRSKGKRES